jgi:hypothetical protein
VQYQLNRVLGEGLLRLREPSPVIWVRSPTVWVLDGKRQTVVYFQSIACLQTNNCLPIAAILTCAGLTTDHSSLTLSPESDSDSGLYFINLKINVIKNIFSAFITSFRILYQYFGLNNPKQRDVQIEVEIQTKFLL